MTIHRFQLNPQAVSYNDNPISLVKNETLVFTTAEDGDGGRIARHSEYGDYEFPDIKPQQYARLLNNAHNAAITGALHHVLQTEKTRSEVKAELIVSGLKLSAVVKDILTDAGIETISELEAITEKELLERTTGLGPARLKELHTALEKIGKTLKAE